MSDDNSRDTKHESGAPGASAPVNAQASRLDSAPETGPGAESSASRKIGRAPEPATVAAANPQPGAGAGNSAPESYNPYGDSFDALLETFSASGDAPESAAVSGIIPKVIGWVRSPLRKLDDCPLSPEDAPEAILEILPEYADGLLGLQPGRKITVLTWLHLAGRDVLQVQGHKGQHGALRGVFGTHSPVRPNPIGLHETVLTAVESHTGAVLLRVSAMETLDGTPVLDIKSGTKPAASCSGPEPVSGTEIVAARKELVRACRAAHAVGLLSGFNGNASLRLGAACLITRSGSLKADLRDEDFALLDIHSGALLDGTTPSSEAKVHLEIYRRQPEAMAVLHTHPPKLMALGLRLPGLPMEKRLEMPVFEAELLRAQLSSTPRFEPGSLEVAETAGAMASTGKAVWLEGHGLCVWGADMRAAFGLSEELEHLAGVRLAGM